MHELHKTLSRCHGLIWSVKPSSKICIRTFLDKIRVSKNIAGFRKWNSLKVCNQSYPKNKKCNFSLDIRILSKNVLIQILVEGLTLQISPWKRLKILWGLCNFTLKICSPGPALKRWFFYFFYLAPSKIPPDRRLCL